MDKPNTKHVRVADPVTIACIEKFAGSERRTFPQMTRLLLDEALDARIKKAHRRPERKGGK